MYVPSREKNNLLLNFIFLFCNNQEILYMNQKQQLNVNVYYHDV